MKRAIIVHCWEGYPEYCWYPWVKKELEKAGFKVIVPAFPDTEKPRQEAWVPYLTNVIGEPDEDLYLVGHSVGCVTIMRYLEALTGARKIGGVVFVAGFTTDLGYEELKNFFTAPIDFDKIRQRCPKFVAIHSDNDKYVDLKYADIFKEQLGAEVIVKRDAGHFSGSIENEGSCIELPEVVTSVKKLSN